MTFSLDTSTCIDVLRGLRSARERYRTETGAAVSSIVVLELWSGVRSTREAEALTVFLSTCSTAAFDDQDATAGAELGRRLREAGTPIDGYDLLIGAQALRRGWTLVTDDVREFSRIPGLKVENWSAPL